MLQQVIDEIKIHSMLNHPNIVKFYGHFFDKFVSSDSST